MKIAFSLALVWLGAFFSAISPAFADGLIVIHVPDDRRIAPPHHYPFAPLEVKNHHVTGSIKDQIATTEVDQVFHNPNNQRLEGTYLFPIPKGAQIDQFSMEIDGKMMEAELLPADKARKIYEDIVRQMKDPALLEYADRNLFKVRIFPIEPKSDKRIKLSYTQILKTENGLSEYLYPLNTEKFSAQPIKTVSIKLTIESKQPLKAIYSPSHEVEIKRESDTKAVIGYEAKNTKPDTDFLVYYATDPKLVGASLLSYRKSGDEGFFLLLASPGLSRPDGKVAPKDITFVLDTSGSMSGDKLPQAKRALQFCIDNLNEGDRFEIIRFSTDTDSLFSKLVEANAGNRAKAADFIKKLKPVGGTAISDALQQALSTKPATDSGPARPYLIVFLTDGEPTIGERNDDKIVASIKDSKTDTRIFCFGIGTDINTHLLDRIAEGTRAASQYVLPEEDIEIKVSNFFSKVTEPILTAPKLTVVDPVKTSKVYPQPLPDLFKGEQLVITGRYSGEGVTKVRIEGTVDGAPHTFEYELDFTKDNVDPAFLPRLWAMRRVGYLLDAIRLNGESKELKDEVTELAREYGIVTPYTAMLIVEDEKQRNVSIERQTVRPLAEARAGADELSITSSGRYNDKAGAGAVSNAKEIQEMKFGINSAAPLERAQQEAAKYYYSAPATSGEADRARKDALQRVSQAAAQTRFVQGRTFYRNGDTWIDYTVAQQKEAKRVQVKFNSDDYFRLANEKPDILPWLSLGSQVQFTVGDTLYEVVN